MMLVSEKTLCLYDRGNFVKSFKTIDEVDEYLRARYVTDAEALRNVDGSGRWSVLESGFLSYAN